ncbi:MarR family winged helix-turn-helix transcriptional regulator [Nocardia africana]|uniref:Homoprotocatechuate degradation operon regulator, HpaR n=1 Tax=Nocardia africana TaxID=134964 RepID=A0A378WV98_9NOCA|nr:MarR family winged helix-turn-helix transcriptional regulator [Nocardia africana]MCC3313484.1 MarR family winged helix-turn-helix transcriptional regulator [Nocardia africana]SUA45148.1 homoprotocatechuate degradation operon regulator, HpaR [Nocardia africana]
MSGKPVPTAAAVASDLRVAVSRLLRQLRAQTEGSDLTKSQSSVLIRLEQGGPATATQLAHAAGMRPQSMAKIVRALEEAGLIAGTPDPADGRKTVLDLTDAARDEFRTGRRAKEDWLTRVIEAEFTDAEIRQLADAVELLDRIGRAG